MGVTINGTSFSFPFLASASFLVTGDSFLNDFSQQIDLQIQLPFQH